MFKLERSWKVVFFTLCILVAVAAAGCSVIESDTPKVGVAPITTGWAAAWGEAEQNAVILAYEDFREGNPDFKAELVFEPVTYEQAPAIAGVSKLINVNQVDVIIGPTWLDGLAGVAPLSTEHDIVMITPSASIDAIKVESDYPNAFSTYYRPEESLENLVRYLDESGQTNVAVVFGNDPWWADVLEKFETAVVGSGVSIVASHRSTLGDVDFRTTFLKVKESGADIIFFGVDDEQGTHAFLRQRQEMFPEIPIISTESAKDYVENPDLAGLFSGMFYILPADTDAGWNARYEARFGTEPVFSAGNSYDAAVMVFSALHAGHRSTEDIKRYLGTTEFDTIVFGPIRFDEDGGLSNAKFQIHEVVDDVPGKVWP